METSSHSLPAGQPEDLALVTGRGARHKEAGRAESSLPRTANGIAAPAQRSRGCDQGLPRFSQDGRPHLAIDREGHLEIGMPGPKLPPPATDSLYTSFPHPTMQQRQRTGCENLFANAHGYT